MIIKFPVAPERYDRSYFMRVLDTIRQSLQFTVRSDRATNSFLLVSQGGKTYRVQVDENGNLTTTLVTK